MTGRAGGQQDPLLHFTPVSLAITRRNGWTSERQRAFVAALARTGVVRSAAASVGMNARSAYRLRDRVGPDHAFARAWDHAMDRARSAAFAVAERALTELEQVPVTYRGRIIGWRTRLNEKLACAALRYMLREEARDGEIPSHCERREVRLWRRECARARAEEAAPTPQNFAPPPPHVPPRGRSIPRVREL
ncbi:hypothetical protein FHS95_000184 [Sphingomonas naasensis]|uniref:Uncharacterized protein n=1 Tax=Sphingomonas naasensis TaxID=1344951 RepID=A0A4S1WQY1_9SPHN|nr:hypothetical protein [Sphingomonas naasensis]NIJ18515.1 hypothetical protein [Sphingomonas naasensis]TGX45768.1 hypothetical protein E5A74_00885 [Sphingomonas naasensis]